MIQLDNRNAEICVVGRFSFGGGIGAMTVAACEMLARSFPISVLPTEAHLRHATAVTLPNGRILPVCRDTSAIKVWLFVDVLWNGAYDTNYLLVGEAGLRIAYVVFDSDEFPAEWVRILNSRFDLALVTSPYMEPVARASGVEIPIGVLPIALDLEPLLARPFAERDPSKIRFLSVAAFHPRKEHGTLLRGFIKAFGDRDDVELVLHSNIAFGDTLEQLERVVRQHGATNIHIRREHLSDEEKNALIGNCDVFVNCSRGEGYSIGPREALALGKPLVLSGTGGHLDLGDCPGVQMIAPRRRHPARYPEIDNRIFGSQYAVEPEDVAQALREAYDLVASRRDLETRHDRRDFAANFSFARLWPSYAEVIDTALRDVQPSAPRARDVSLPPAFRTKVEKAIGRGATGLSHPSRRIVQMHDGGYFSIFNVFFSNLVWDLREERCRMTLPDWDVSRMIGRLGTDRLTSFCYGRPEDGNIWLKLYEPLFGLSNAEMNDEALLYRNAVRTDTAWNEEREPLLTYVHAYRLYLSPGFSAWRRQYHAVYRDHIRLRSDYAAEIDAFTASRFDGRFMIAAHVRHPSHGMEQPGLAIAHTQAYIERVRVQLRQRGIDPEGDGWGVFLATDQDRVVQQFVEAFGDRVSFFDDVRRTRIAEDEAFEALSAEERKREGHQVQHLVAADHSGWSTRMAWEIIRDATAMSRCNVLLHVVSNVSTAVAYMNPNIELVFTY